jgi:hypothetical protein
MSARFSRDSVSVSLSGKQSSKHGLRGTTTFIHSNVAPGIPEFKMRMIDAIIIPFMSQNWKTLEENLFMMEVFKEQIDEMLMRDPFAEITIYKDLISVIEIAFLQQNEIMHLEKRLYEGREDVSTLVIKLDAMRLKPELELYDLILGKPDYKRGMTHDATIVSEINALMKTRRATFSNISKYIKHKFVSNYL